MKQNVIGSTKNNAVRSNVSRTEQLNGSAWINNNFWRLPGREHSTLKMKRNCNFMLAYDKISSVFFTRTGSQVGKKKFLTFIALTICLYASFRMQSKRRQWHAIIHFLIFDLFSRVLLLKMPMHWRHNIFVIDNFGFTKKKLSVKGELIEDKDRKHLV